MKKRIILAAAAVFIISILLPEGREFTVSADMGKKGLIVIDAGHQGKGNGGLEPIGPGASSKKPKVASGTTGRASKMTEYQLNLIVARKLSKELKQRGYQVKMIRKSHNVNISNSKRAKMANRWGADAFIRIHANGDVNTSISGALTMAPTSGNRYLSKNKCLWFV